MARKTTGIQVERGSGNVFADLGFPDPELERFKATLMLDLPHHHTAQTDPGAGRQGARHQAAECVRPMRGSSGSYSVERLMEFLTALGHNVEVEITPTRRKHGAMSVVVAA